MEACSGLLSQGSVVHPILLILQRLPGSGSGSGPRGTVRQCLSKQAIAGRAGGAEIPSFAPCSFGDGGDDGSESSGIGGGGSQSWTVVST